MTIKIHVGVSGFSYPSWKGKFYPAEAKSEELLTLYSQRLGSVEINSSFYAQPSAAMVKSWAERTSGNFVFAFKAHRQITHILKLGEGSSEAAERFSKTIDKLGPRRGPILFQLPPYSKLDLPLLERFLTDTSGIKGKVFEFRHRSWFEDSTFSLLDEREAGFCVAETEDLEPVFRIAGGVAYFRLRKDSYDAGAIDAWARKIHEASQDSRETYVYLRHDESGENAILAQRLSEGLGAGKTR